jgi:hypothetical protein
MSGFEVTPQQRAAWELRDTIRRMARDVHGAEIVQVPMEGFRTMTKPVLDDPLAGVRAAVLARDVALAELRQYAEQARGAGRSWDDVAEALGIEATEDGEPRDEQTYLLLVEGRPLPDREPSWFHRRKAWWTCTTCGQQVADHGPFESHPDDVEQGHADSCARRAAALTAHGNEHT